MWDVSVLNIMIVNAKNSTVNNFLRKCTYIFGGGYIQSYAIQMYTFSHNTRQTEALLHTIIKMLQSNYVTWQINGNLMEVSYVYSSNKMTSFQQPPPQNSIIGLLQHKNHRENSLNLLQSQLPMETLLLWQIIYLPTNCFTEKMTRLVKIDSAPEYQEVIKWILTKQFLIQPHIVYLVICYIYKVTYFKIYCYTKRSDDTQSKP